LEHNYVDSAVTIPFNNVVENVLLDIAQFIEVRPVKRRRPFHILGLGITPVIPFKTNQDREQRAVKFDPDTYRSRNIIERLIGWLNECRRIHSQFEKTAKNFLGMIRVAFIHRYLRLTCC
jgi:transposase